MNTPQNGKIALDRSISSAQKSDRSIGKAARRRRVESIDWDAVAAALSAIADLDDEIAADVTALIERVDRWTEEQKSAITPGEPTIRGDDDVAATIDMEFRRLYPRANPATMRATREYHEFARIRLGQTPTEHSAPADAAAEQACKSLGVDPISATRIVAELGAAAVQSMVGWVRSQGARSPSGLLMSTARRRGYTG